ncbi:MAG: radical SAM family heme chaperone HemW [Tabrizicola sp.]|uniref:radical SAM family heme chaperone HemW n=1 Tax=Tabrizicola sp. TaxID=2005166 RepID=UPI002ABB3E48|nr:radical SAM family heme chaperone HemW [Tabrizicola sp.]MDZ4089011.1 radical SAM family heme chaperone HemW [Tabrizicola sp.]
MEDWKHAGFGLYIHWPFCQSKCPYCDFNSHVATRIDQSRWLQAFQSEIDRIGALTQGRVLNTIFFGGGTPSLMEPATVQGILDRVRATWTLANDIEITLEANPGSVEAARFEAYAKAGVNRVSLGIQSLDPEDLRRLGRMHTVDEAAKAIAIAQSTFDRVSIDLIYARQNQPLAAWRDELNRALDFGTSHLSLYQLTIEDGTVFGQMHAKNLLKGLPEEDLSADMFELTQEITRNAGLPAYEVSNHARPGDESRHNLIYWRMGDYAGIGPGAHGRLTLDSARFATEAERQPTPWLNQTLSLPGSAEATDRLSAEDRASEYLMFALRLKEGASLSRFAALAGAPLSAAALSEVTALGFLHQDGDRIHTTETGVMMLNGILRALLANRQSAG